MGHEQQATPADGLPDKLPDDLPGDLPEHVAANVMYWDGMAADWVASGERLWALREPTWGQWGVPDDEAPLLPTDCSGLDVVELGCGTGYVSGWAARRGARRVVGVDTSAQQLATARRLADEHGVDLELLHASAEDVPLPDDSFDVVVSEYGAATWADPERWVREAWRLLRPGGRLGLLTNHHLVTVCSPLDGSLPVVREVVRPWFGQRVYDWRDAVDEPGGIEFSLSPASWFRLLREVGFDVVDHREPRAPDGTDQRPFAVTAAWARDLPSEQVWVARRPD